MDPSVLFCIFAPFVPIVACLLTIIVFSARTDAVDYNSLGNYEEDGVVF